MAIDFFNFKANEPIRAKTYTKEKKKKRKKKERKRRGEGRE
jgi:hypothetical protein